MKSNLFLFLILVFISSCAAPKLTSTNTWSELTSANGSTPVARHEAAFIGVGNKFYLLGGRGVRPVSIYDATNNTWKNGAEPPVEIHHFQPVVYQNEIYLLGAMTGKYPGETPLPHIYIYSPANDNWRKGPEIPEDRRRGGAGVALMNDKIYLVCGIRDGHRGDHKKWLDEYDLKTGTWKKLSDAPRPRDHFQAVIKNNKLYALAGRTTVAATNPFANVIGEVDVYDFKTGTWSTLPNHLPTLRAGNTAIDFGDEILVIGGESKDQEVAHNEVEGLNVKTKKWQKHAPLSRGRHGTGVIDYRGKLYMASGCGNHGGEPELDDLIRLSY